MALKLLRGIYAGDYMAKIYRDSEWNEYRVKFYVKGVHQKDGDFHTDDKEDAFATAGGQLDRYQSKNPSHVPRQNAIKPSRRTIGMKSQRPHKDPKTGKFVKTATPRLQKRRAKDTIPGYYPNPAKRDAIDSETFRIRLLKYAQKLIDSREALRMGTAGKEMHIAYIDGLLYAGVMAGIVSVADHDDTMREVRGSYGV